MSIIDSLKKLVVALGGAKNPDEVKGNNIAEVVDTLSDSISSGGSGIAIISMGENLQNEVNATLQEASIKALGSPGERVSVTRVIPKDSGAAWDEWSNVCEGFAAAISANQLVAFESLYAGQLTPVNLFSNNGCFTPNMINVIGPNSFMEVSITIETTFEEPSESCNIDVVLCMFATE